MGIPSPDDSWAQVELFRWQYGVLPEPDDMRPIIVPEALKKMAEALRANMKAGTLEKAPDPFNCSQVMLYAAKLLEKVPEKSPIAERFDPIYKEILLELGMALKKFPSWPEDILHAFGVVVEEIGEAQKDIMQSVYEPHKNVDAFRIRKEVIQSAAMCFRFLLGMKFYAYKKSRQLPQ
jgi:hypothetical protein